jgi:Nucleotidyltransferase domain.
MHLQSDDSEDLKEKFSRILRRARQRILEEEPDTIGIVVDGSVARCKQGPYSDVDMIALRKSAALKKLFYFDEGIQVDIWFMAIDEYNKTPKGLDAFYDWGTGSRKVLFDKNGKTKMILAKKKVLKPTNNDVQEALEHSCRNLIESSSLNIQDGYVIQVCHRII